MKRWILSAAAAILAITLTVTLALQSRRAAAAERILHETTIASLAESAEALQLLTLNMDKLQLSRSAHQQAAYLQEMALASDRARQQLAALPVDQQQLSPALAYLSDVAALCGDCLTALVDEGNAEEALQGLLARQGDLTLLHAEIDLAHQDMLRGGTISASLPQTAVTTAPSAAELAAYRGLPPTEIGSGMALQAARSFVGEERVTGVAPAPDTHGALPAFGVTVQTSDVQLNLEITRRGGKVLMMSPETAGFSVLVPVQDCIASAGAFLESRGFVTMEPTHYQQYDGLCVITFVHVQEGALVWPDRVCVQVRMDTAEVVGLEARSYWQHHTPRKLPAPQLTAAQAQTALHPSLHVLKSRLCLLPISGREVLCWQFTTEYAGDRYIVFINADNGQEVRLDKVMQLEAGTIPA